MSGDMFDGGGHVPGDEFGGMDEVNALYCELRQPRHIHDIVCQICSAAGCMHAAIPLCKSNHQTFIL
jgi:hypothetical protein